MDSDERVDALIGHGLKVARDTAVGLGELGLAEAPGYLCDVNDGPKDRFIGATEVDEGRPLDVSWQRQASNQAVLLKPKRLWW